MKRRNLILLTLLLVFALVLSACGGDTGEEVVEPEGEETEAVVDGVANPAATRENADKLIIGITETDGVFNPIFYTTAYDANVIDVVFDGLVTTDDEANPVPLAAEEWTISEDGKSITFKIREDIKFQDGEPLTAEDVVFTYQAMADPSYDGRYSYIPAKLEGYEEYLAAFDVDESEEAEETDEEVEETFELEGELPEYAGVVANGDYEVTFNFIEANATNLLDAGFGILPAHYYEYEPGNLPAIKDLNTQPMGSGPYALENYAIGEYVELKSNPDYFLGEAKTESIILRFTNKETELQAFENGEFDVIQTIENSPENQEVVEGIDFATLRRFDNNGYAYIGLNMDNPNLAKKEVRQALTYGFDRYAFVEDFFEGAATVPNVPFARVSWVFTDELESNLNDYEYDPEKAIELLESVGYDQFEGEIRTDGTNKLSFQFETYADTAWTETLVAILKDEWTQIGVEINENFQEFSGFSTKIYEDRDFDMYTMAWSLAADPSPRNIFHSENITVGGNNSVGWDDPENDRLLEAGELELDIEERKVIYKEWGELFNEELPYIPVYMRENWAVVNDRVQGYDVSPYDDFVKRPILLNLELVD